MLKLLKRFAQSVGRDAYEWQAIDQARVILRDFADQSRRHLADVIAGAGLPYRLDVHDETERALPRVALSLFPQTDNGGKAAASYAVEYNFLRQNLQVTKTVGGVVSATHIPIMKSIDVSVWYPDKLDEAGPFFKQQMTLHPDEKKRLAAEIALRKRDDKAQGKQKSPAAIALSIEP